MERAELVRLVQATGVAERLGEIVLLRDPHWSPAQRAIFAGLMARPVQPGPGGAGWLGIATGGSSGGLRFARHDEETLGAAARGFAAHYGLGRINAVDVLPPWHVSGFMARVRCAVSGGRHVPWDWKDLTAGRCPELTGGDWVLSLVPTQLQRLLGQPVAVDWLRRMRIIFIGGGPAWPDLVDETVKARLPVALSYGMTETAAMVVAQTPAECAAGDRSSGRPLPHARIEIVAENRGTALTAEATGLVRISGGSVMRGYYPDWREEPFLTADLGWLDQSGRLHIQGRRDDVIISGGEKVNPLEVEAVLQSQGWFRDVAVIGRPHPQWGREVVACYVPVEAGFDPVAHEREIARHLSRHQRPKHWLAFAEAEWPRNAQGKVSRAALLAAASARVHPSGEG